MSVVSHEIPIPPPTRPTTILTLVTWQTYKMSVVSHEIPIPPTNKTDRH